ncbi:MAG: response regulator [Anaerolinea sp.]|nr:response regulator [Anaerolinea sp.]MCC6972600.1 response regulator [Anaerolineae bacterium]CAG1007487.1 Transcriptional regulatory protein CreB [Anaerolineae bacterium]
MSHILLVEDNQGQADMIIHVLSASGYEVKHALRGLDGAKMARTDRPDLILMDFNLPDIDGRTLAMLLKKQLGDADAPPIVACTARVSANEKHIAKHFGCADFLGKPFTPEELLTVVGRFIPLPGDFKTERKNGDVGQNAR